MLLHLGENCWPIYRLLWVAVARTEVLCRVLAVPITLDYYKVESLRLGANRIGRLNTLVLKRRMDFTNVKEQEAEMTRGWQSHHGLH